MFLYLATREVPVDFRAYLLRHADLLKSVDEWTVRVLVPRRFRKATALYRYPLRDWNPKRACFQVGDGA